MTQSARESVWPLVQEVGSASVLGLHTMSLMGALTLPDIAAALGSSNGRTSGSKYQAWLVEHASKEPETAKEIYGLRCSLLHQGTQYPHGTTIRVAFIWPDAPTHFHNVTTEIDGKEVHWFDIPRFVDEISHAVERWLDQYGETATVLRNVERFARLRPDGLPPHVVGIPVIA